MWISFSTSLGHTGEPVPTWIQKYRADIVFVVSMLAGAALIAVGLYQGDSPTIILGAGALGIPGFQKAASA